MTNNFLIEQQNGRRLKDCHVNYKNTGIIHHETLKKNAFTHFMCFLFWQLRHKERSF